MSTRCTKPVGDSDGGEFCNEEVADELDHTCYDHARLCLYFPCRHFKEWNQPFCPEHMKYRESQTV